MSRAVSQFGIRLTGATNWLRIDNRATLAATGVVRCTRAKSKKRSPPPQHRATPGLFVFYSKL
eukprot:4105276-Prymnesium_polylepis.1